MLLLQECEVVDELRILKPMFKQRLAANSKALVITDIGLFSVLHLLVREMLTVVL